MLVRVGRSSICEGRGLFAARFLPKGTLVTQYCGARRGPSANRTRASSLEKTDNVEATEYSFECADGSSIDGRPGLWSGVKCRGGVAQFANDALHPEATGRKNNCAFVEVPPSRGSVVVRVYLRTTRDVRAGDELLVPYSLCYWLSRARNRPDVIPAGLIAWLNCHVLMEDAVRTALRSDGSTLDGYVGMQGDGALYKTFECGARESVVCGCPGGARRHASILVTRTSPDDADTHEVDVRCTWCQNNIRVICAP